MRSAIYLSELLVAALWVAISAASPEFIWQGLRAVFSHATAVDLSYALVTGMILAFFVEPTMERVRAWLHRRQGESVEHGESHALFIAAMSLAFALVTVCIHDAITTFVSGHRLGGGGRNASVSGAIQLTAAWAFIPFVVTLAWESGSRRLLDVPMLLLGLASPALAGWLFGWPWQEVAVTVVPTAAILLVGRREVRRGSPRRTFARCGAWVALTAAVSVPAVLGFCAMLHALGATSFRIYTTDQFWIDCRFYLGWSIGLALAPFPRGGRPHPPPSSPRPSCLHETRGQ